MKQGRMVGRTYRLPQRVWWGQGIGGRGLVRVIVQGAGWPTNVLVERLADGTRFVRPARGLRKP